jgi:hypothetical protein
VLWSTESAGALFDRFHFVGTTTRAHHALDSLSISENETKRAKSPMGMICQSPDMVSSFNERILPLLRPVDHAIAGELMRAGSPPRVRIKGCRVQISFSDKTGDGETQLIRMLELIESVMQWLQELPDAAAADTCRACGVQGDDGQCGRCGSPYHNACWQQFGGCQVWGCRDNDAMLEAIRRPLLRR